MAAASDFVHLHLHTLYSLLDGAIRIKDLLKTVQAKGMKSVAVTDHGNLFGAVDFYKKAKDAGVKPILGMESYVAGPKGRLDRSERVGRHLILLAKNAEGWANLRILSSKAFTEGFYYDPRIDKPLLKEHSKGLIGLTACLAGEIPRLIRHGEMDAARDAAREYRSIFEPGSFFLEIQSNGMREQLEVNAKMAQLARDEGIPLVATADAHYVRREDAKAHEVLMCIASNKTFQDPKRLRHDTDGLYITSPDDMVAALPGFEDAVARSAEIAEMCNVELPLGKTYLPRFALPDGLTEDEYIDKLAKEGLDRRFKEIEGKYPHDRDAYRARLELELGVIIKMKFPGYFLIVQDFINWAKDHDIPVGPGRGSGAGSIVAYSIRITDIDPMPYNLLFERFLNPERISMPDIDVDFCTDRRDEVIQYVTEKYGRDKVCQIITFGTMAARGVIRDVGRALDMTYGDVDRIAKLIPEVLGITLKKALEQEPKLKELINADQKVQDLIEIALCLEGLARHASTHAAGVVVAPDMLEEFCPVYKDQKTGVINTQYSMKYVEKIGLVKFDFLGLKNLTVIDNAVKLIRAGKDPGFDITALSDDDAASYELISEGNTTGVFQLEGSGMREMLRDLKPSCFEDVIAAVALYRPGPLNSGMVKDFIDRKHGRKKVVYDLPELEPILRDTYGVIVYQEQVMQIARSLAGYSLGGADLLRRAMGKKDPAAMAKEKDKFLAGAKEQGVDLKKAEAIFDQMAKFAEYGFNKSY